MSIPNYFLDGFQGIHQLLMLSFALSLLVGLFFLPRYFLSSPDERAERSKSAFALCLLIGLLANLVALMPILIDEGDSNQSVDKVTQHEITNEDYRFLVNSLLINEKSMIGEIQLEVIKTALSDGYITVEEITNIPDLNFGGYSESATSKLKIQVSDQYAKDMLLQMTKRVSND